MKKFTESNRIDLCRIHGKFQFAVLTRANYSLKIYKFNIETKLNFLSFQLLILFLRDVLVLRLTFSVTNAYWRSLHAGPVLLYT